jgi:hypothetical protein
VDQELLTLPGHPSSPPVFSGVRVTRSLVLCVCFVERCLSFCPFSFGHCVACSSSIYVFLLLLWHLETFLVRGKKGKERKENTPISQASLQKNVYNVITWSCPH